MPELRVHPPLVAAIVDTLDEVFLNARPADRALEKKLKANKQFGARDRRFIAESVYECVRWARRLEACGEGIYAPGVSAGQKLTSTYATLHEWSHTPLDGMELAEAVERWEALEDAPRAVRESIPDELDTLAFTELGERWDKELPALNEKAPVDLRVNTLLTTIDELMQMLAAEEIPTKKVPGFPDTLTLPERKNVFRTKAFHGGLFEVQDRSSQRVVPLLGVKPGERVIDACAGAGGKTMHIGSLMQNKGRIIALDIHEWKLNELQVRARRDKFSNIETRVITSTKVVKRLEDSADRVLLDVPCSGMGVLRRNPDSKWRLTAEEVDRLRLLQKDLLSSYSRMVKVGGTLVYATCSILPSENEAQVEAFLQAKAGAWDLEESFHAWPSDRNGDGFFAARLKKKS